MDRPLTLFEVNEAAEIVHSVAHQDANIIFGSVVDEARWATPCDVTVIAAGFEHWEANGTAKPCPHPTPPAPPVPEPIDLFGDAPQEEGSEFSFDLDDEGDDDIPSFLR